MGYPESAICHHALKAIARSGGVVMGIFNSGTGGFPFAQVEWSSEDHGKGRGVSIVVFATKTGPFLKGNWDTFAAVAGRLIAGWFHLEESPGNIERRSS